MSMSPGHAEAVPDMSMCEEQNQAKERGWNRTTLRTRPPNLVGLRCATKEPWAIDEIFYQKKTGNMEEEFNELGRYDDAYDVLSGYYIFIYGPGPHGLNNDDASPNEITWEVLKERLKALAAARLPHVIRVYGWCPLCCWRWRSRCRS